MNSASKKFGQLPHKELSKQTQKTTAKINFGTHPAEEKASRGEGAIAWTSYLTMIYAAAIAFIPETAAAAIITVRAITG